MSDTSEAKKVRRIPPHSIRFFDPRVDRTRYAPWLRSRNNRQEIKTKTKHLAPYFKALREDARFAAPKLIYALDIAIHNASQWDLFRRLLDKHCNEMFFCPSWKAVKNISSGYVMAVSAHTSVSDAAKIACYPTRSDARRHREVVMSPGKFYASVFPHHAPSVIQRMAEEYARENAPSSLFFVDNNTKTTEELREAWVEIYGSARGFSSCMKGFEDSEIHPVEFYARANNNLALAYLTHDNQPSGEVTARAICNTKCKRVVRVYGDARLVGMLEDAGYELDSYQALQGVECNALRLDGGLVAPYIDGDMSIEWDGESGSCHIRRQGNYSAQHTCGFAYSKDGTVCVDCEEHVDPDDIRYLSYHDRHVCSSCLEENYVEAYTGRRTLDYIDVDETIEVDDVIYLNDSEVLIACGLVYCEEDSTWIQACDAVYLEHKSDYYHVDNLTSLDIPYEGDNYALEHETKTIMLEGQERVVHEDYDGPVDDDDETSEEQTTEPNETSCTLAA